MFAHYGITRFFSDVYKRLSTIVMLGCGPLPAELQPTGIKKRMCEKTMRSFPEVLAQWPEPIDILILVFGFRPYTEIDQHKQIEVDSGYRFMQQFYSRAAEHVRELVIIEKEHVVFGDSPAQSILRRSTSLPQEPLRIQREHHALMRRRYEKNKLSSLCKIRFNGRLVFDSRNGLTWHIDDNHISSYGALHHAQQLRIFYDQTTGNQSD
ncbi:hypothetical protein M3Y98_00715500 [Aphelenchoides besseyi]|nr:hypothetical protein M3Y98_00715500 [Aphelenchoides besseyi]